MDFHVPWGWVSDKIAYKARDKHKEERSHPGKGKVWGAEEGEEILDHIVDLNEVVALQME